MAGLARAILFAALLQEAPAPVVVTATPTPVPPDVVCQGFTLGLPREEALKPASSKVLTTYQTVAMVRFEGSIVPWPNMPPPSWTDLFFDADDHLETVEAVWPVETGPMEELRKELTVKYGRPARTGATDFSWKPEGSRVKIFLSRGKWLVGQPHLTVLALRQQLVRR